MEVDSMHSSIERILKTTLPAYYIEVRKCAARNPFPYEVECLTHDFFKNFFPLNYFSSIRPRRLVDNPTFIDIKALKYENGTITYKLCHTCDTWNKMHRRIKMDSLMNTESFKDLRPLYSSKRKIKKEK